MSKNKQVATEISELLPTFLRYMFPYVFQPVPLPPSQVLALVSIQERRGCTLTELKNEMHVSAPTITGIVNRLLRDGYITRERDVKDRRVVNVALTAKGSKIVQKFRDNIRKRWEYILEKTPKETGATVVKTMGGIVSRFLDGTM